jgi:hypothetical protein
VTSVYKPRYIPTRAIPPLPPSFESNFIAGGWRQVERVYGCRDEVILKWIEMCGGEELYAKRREARRQVATAVTPPAGKG